ncbi:MAG: TOBE domain-containing protein, partial [Clostridia bacterium]|nr:TOBE domain-containing protein [Clostridia bacterium]
DDGDGSIGEGTYSVEVLGTEYPLTAEQCRKLADRGIGNCSVTVGVRPANIHVGSNAEGGGRIGGIEAAVEVAEMMGSEMHLHMNAGGDEIIAVVQTSEVESDDVSIGSRMNIGFRPKRIHLFDSETEESLLV